MPLLPFASAPANLSAYLPLAGGTLTGNLLWSGVGNATPLIVSNSLTGSSTNAAMSITATWNTTGAATAFRVNTTSTASAAASLLADFQVGGVSKMSIRKDGALYGDANSILTLSGGFMSYYSGGAQTLQMGAQTLSFGSNGLTNILSWAGGSQIYGIAGGNAFDARNGTSAQQWRIYETTDAGAVPTNYSRLTLKAQTAADFLIIPEAGGTGTLRGLQLGSSAGKLGVFGATAIVQPTTAIAASTFVANTSLIANDTATFDGYTIGQVVKALRNFGLLQ